MSSNTHYIDLSQLKKSLFISAENTDSDDKLLDILFTAELELDTALRPYVTVPLDTEAVTFAQAQKCVLLYARQMWMEHIEQLDKARYSLEVYEKKMENLLKAVQSSKPERRQVQYITGDDPLERTYSTSEVDQYLAREFT